MDIAKVLDDAAEMLKCGIALQPDLIAQHLKDASDEITNLRKHEECLRRVKRVLLEFGVDIVSDSPVSDSHTVIFTNPRFKLGHDYPSFPDAMREALKWLLSIAEGKREKKGGLCHVKRNCKQSRKAKRLKRTEKVPRLRAK